MKKIIVAALLMCTISVSYAQLEIDRYNNQNEIISTENIPNAMEWVVDDQGTTSKADDMLYMFRYSSDGILIASATATILETTLRDKTFSFKVQNPDESWYTVTFWYEREDVIPMVAYEFSDGILVYTGAVNY